MIQLNKIRRFPSLEYFNLGKKYENFLGNEIVCDFRVIFFYGVVRYIKK